MMMTKPYDVVGFDDTIIFRVRSEEKDRAEKIIAQHTDIYDDLSHFARSWFIRGLRNYNEPLREQQKQMGMKE